jgi:hypothetical protein
VVRTLDALLLEAAQDQRKWFDVMHDDDSQV